MKTDEEIINEARALIEERVAAEDAGDKVRASDCRWKFAMWLHENGWQVMALLLESRAEIDRLRELVPKTADGVFVADCSEVYCPRCKCELRELDGYTYECRECNRSKPSEYFYSDFEDKILSHDQVLSRPDAEAKS